MTTSIRARFGFSLLANLSKAAFTFGTGMLVARSLGPGHYGTMTFLLGTFAAARQLLDMGSSTAFFTFLSQRPRGRRFVFWYFAWLGVQFLVPLLFVGLLLPEAWLALIWKGEQRSLVLLAFLAAYLQSVLWGAVLQMGESQRLTRSVQGVALAIALVHFVLMVMAWWGGWLDIRWLFVVMSIEWGIAVVVIAKQLRFPTVSDEPDTLKSVASEFWRYCMPLIPYAWLGFVYEFADRWLLQNYAGSVQQAYYAVAYQFGAIAAIATSSILSIFWKEIAEAHHQRNDERVAMLYRRVSRGLFFASAAVAGFFVPWSEDILRLILGPAYVSGAATLTIMFLYPLHQSMGQIGGTMLLATGRVRAQVILGMCFMAASIVVSYFLLAPATAPIPGLGLNSIGLAGKMVVMQFLGVNMVAFYLARNMKIDFDWTYQPLSGIGCVAAGWLAYTSTQWLVADSAYILLSMLVACIFYAVMLLAVVGFNPGLAGLQRSDFSNVLSKGIRMVGR
jgi:O-antigen/teichoic acid export membrane protein